MKRFLNYLALVLLVSSLATLPSFSFGKKKEIKESIPETIPGTKPTCDNAGKVGCSEGLQPLCPKDHKPSCVFVGTMYLPSCLANSSDNTFFSYKLNNISCGK